MFRDLLEVDAGRVGNLLERAVDCRVEAGLNALTLIRHAGIEPTVDADPEKFRRSLAADVALWTPIVKALGIKVD